MATFIATIQFTQQGAANYMGTVQRAETLKNEAKSMGIAIRDVFWTLGALDGILIFDAPSDESATALMLRISAKGNVKTQTHRAFDAAEMQKILSQASS